MTAGLARLRGVVATALAGLVFAAAPAGAGRPLRIVCIGDSITAGITTLWTGERLEPGMDPLGGYPERLQKRLGPGVQVTNRGISGAPTEWWLAAPWPPSQLVPLWSKLLDLWPDWQVLARPEGARSLLEAVLAHDRPDLVVVLIGANDLAFVHDPGPQDADAVVTHLTEIRAQASLLAPRVVIASLLPNHRDSPALIDRINRGLARAQPDRLPLGEGFARAGWPDLLADRIHPNASGYDLLADLVAAELRRRGLVAQPAPGVL